MKIGTFARMTGIPVSTIRYYISEELLTPVRKGAQYDFHDENLQEIQQLMELRQMNFSVEEMKRYVNVIRMLDSRDELRYTHLLSILRNKQEDIEENIRNLHGAGRRVELVMSRLKLEESMMVSRDPERESEAPSGLSTDFLPILRCPECGGSINLDNARIRRGDIIDGEIVCSCGYRGIIEDGIVNVDPDINLDDDPVFLDDYFGEQALENRDFSLQYEGFLTARPDFLMIQHKSRDWIHRKITEESHSPNVILFPDIASLFLYLHVDAEYLRNARIIVMGMSRKGVEANRHHLEALGSNLKVMYVVAPSNRLPIVKGCVDLLVDYLATFNYAFFYDRQLYEYLGGYLTKDAVIAGATVNYSKEAKSLTNIEESYTRSMKPFPTMADTMNLLEEKGYKILDREEIGRCISMNDYFDFHEEGEAHEVHAFYAERRKGE